MSFVLGLWLVCGFFANLPTASSIQCYASAADYPRSKDPCEGNPAIQCESIYDSCSTLKTKVEFAGLDFISNQTVTNCAIAEPPGCNQTYICELVNKDMSKIGAKLLQCDLDCCQTDRCNGPDEDEPNPTTSGPNPQSELKYFIETVRALLDELENIVDNEGQLSATEYKERLKEVLNNFYVAITNEEEQKSNHTMDELKTNAAVLMKKLETMRGMSKKKRAAMPMRQKKLQAKLSEAMESLARLAAQKR